jgi:hypothetical protein
MSEISVAVNSLAETNNLLRLDVKKLVIMESMIKDILQVTTALQNLDGVRYTDDNPVHALSLAISNFGAHGRSMAYEQDLLRSLHFLAIQARHEKIETAHAGTYEWIFRLFRIQHSPSDLSNGLSRAMASFGSTDNQDAESRH